MQRPFRKLLGGGARLVAKKDEERPTRAAVNGGSRGRANPFQRGAKRGAAQGARQAAQQRAAPTARSQARGKPKLLNPNASSGSHRIVADPFGDTPARKLVEEQEEVEEVEEEEVTVESTEQGQSRAPTYMERKLARLAQNTIAQFRGQAPAKEGHSVQLSIAVVDGRPRVDIAVLGLAVDSRQDFDRLMQTAAKRPSHIEQEQSGAEVPKVQHLLLPTCQQAAAEPGAVDAVLRPEAPVALAPRERRLAGRPMRTTLHKSSKDNPLSSVFSGQEPEEDADDQENNSRRAQQNPFARQPARSAPAKNGFQYNKPRPDTSMFSRPVEQRRTYARYQGMSQDNPFAAQPQRQQSAGNIFAAARPAPMQRQQQRRGRFQQMSRENPFA